MQLGLQSQLCTSEIFTQLVNLHKMLLVTSESRIAPEFCMALHKKKRNGMRAFNELFQCSRAVILLQEYKQCGVLQSFALPVSFSLFIEKFLTTV